MLEREMTTRKIRRKFLVQYRLERTRIDSKVNKKLYSRLRITLLLKKIFISVLHLESRGAYASDETCTKSRSNARYRKIYLKSSDWFVYDSPFNINSRMNHNECISLIY